MSSIAPFPRLIIEEDPVEVAAPPKPFVKVVSTPPGLPWDQTRAAELEARVGAPLPLDKVVYRVKRLEPWQPGHAARFAAVYFRGEELGGRLDATVEIDGRTLSLNFLSRQEGGRRARMLAIAAAAAGVTTFLAVAGIGMALTTRAQATAQLEALEQLVAKRSREVEVRRSLKAQAKALDQEGLAGRSLSDFLNDLAWASEAKAPGARIQAFHWDRGYLAVEARGDAAPFVETARRVERYEKPIKPGRWLWSAAEEQGR
jgi:hypothetical protein